MNLSDIKDSEKLSWLYFTADLTMLDYYLGLYEQLKNNKGTIKTSITCDKSTYLNKLKVKYADLYCKIIEQHQDHYHKMAARHYKTNYSISELPDNNHFLYDIMTLNQEILMYDLLALNAIMANPHEKLVFCYKYLIDGWNSKLILEKLRKKTLDKIFIGFINEYSRQSGLPQMVTLCYFYPLEEDLHKTAKGLVRLNRHFTSISIKEFLQKSKHEKIVFIKNVIDKRINNIDKWCNRLREKIIRNTIEFLYSVK